MKKTGSRDLKTLLRRVEPKVIEYRREIHKHAEAGWMEFYTASCVAKELDRLGLPIRMGREVVDARSRMGLPDPGSLEHAYERALQEGADPAYARYFQGGFTGIVARIDPSGHRQNPGCRETSSPAELRMDFPCPDKGRQDEAPERKALAIRFDMDAVEVRESPSEAHQPARLGFSSIHPEAMHACGHDGHTAIGLGVAHMLSALSDRLTRPVLLIFQPAEEGARGAKAMAEAGVVDEVDIFLGIHLGVKALSTGECYCGAEGFLATSKLDAFFRGHSVHAGIAPQEGKNALLAAATAVLNLQAIPRHGEGDTRINVGKLVAGSGRNVIPADAHLVLETRGGTAEVDRYVREYAERILEHAAQMHGVESRVIAMGEGLDGRSDDELVDQIYRVTKTSRVFSEVKRKLTQFGGSEDCTHLMRRVQLRGGRASYLILGSRLAGNHHTERFDFDESILIKGVEWLTRLALEL